MCCADALTDQLREVLFLSEDPSRRGGAADVAHDLDEGRQDDRMRSSVAAAVLAVVLGSAAKERAIGGISEDSEGSEGTRGGTSRPASATTGAAVAEARVQLDWYLGHLASAAPIFGG